ncbi:hypothetical protein EDB92DRAFT_1853351 [Lactarius akahatsu]|uniref:Uncharacterized protein n=1 Tax=Lactarius akahatsu TaxID=416441 RepID=A0AAD4Q969_9AGAM|nr:hypothetical protein EDB92DRAFT_1853351 [Lactarius akahatsu]
MYALAPLSRIVDYLASCLDRGLIIASQSSFWFDFPRRNQIPDCLNDLDTHWYLHGHEVSGHLVLSLRYLRRYLWRHGALPITYAFVLGLIDFFVHGKSSTSVAWVLTFPTFQQFLCRSLSRGRANCCALSFIPPRFLNVGQVRTAKVVLCSCETT